jgi:serine/threonine-protein kinase
VIAFLRRGLAKPPVDRRLEDLFARGIDPDTEASAVPRSGASTVWPSRDEVRAFGRACDEAVLSALNEEDVLPLEGLYTALEHEAIPKLYELAYDGDSPYLVTELVPGVTFDTMLGDGQRYEPLGIIDLMRPIAGALDYAHSRATVHRDVKPANILLADDGRTLLTGFGLGTVASFNTGPGATGPVAPDYVAPERLVGHEVDGRADVYSLAAVIFEATTGRRPFSSRSWIETLSRRLYEPPPNVRDVAPELSPAFAGVLQQAMDRDPARRPATAGELLDRLESAITSPNGQPMANGSAPKRALRRLLRR